MKKLLLSLIVLVFFGALNNVIAKKIQTSKFNPSPQGTYAKPTEHHNPATDYHSLACDGPGSYECKWETSPWSKMVVYDEIENDVANNIGSGVLTGSYVMEEEEETIVVTWNATSLVDYSFELDISEN